MQFGCKTGQNSGVVTEWLIARTADDHSTVHMGVHIQPFTKCTHGISVSFQPLDKRLFRLSKNLLYFYSKLNNCLSRTTRFLSKPDENHLENVSKTMTRSTFRRASFRVVATLQLPNPDNPGQYLASNAEPLNFDSFLVSSNKRISYKYLDTKKNRSQC